MGPKAQNKMGPLTLVVRHQNSYTMNMKQLTIKQIVFTICALTLSVPSFAQGAGALATAGRELIEGGEAAVRAATEASNVTSRITQAVTRAANAPSYATRGYNFDIATQPSVAKKMLNLNTQYYKERMSAASLLTEINEQMQANLLLTNAAGEQLPLPAAQQLKLATRIETVAQNKSLKNFLNEDLFDGDYALAMRDLADYYSLSTEFIETAELRFVQPSNTREVFVHTTLDYIKRHPHKVTLKLREILKNPYINKNLTDLIKVYVNSPFIDAAHEIRFTSLLRAAYDQHMEVLADTRNSAEITEVVELYKDLLQRLRGFIAQNNRAPRWNGLTAERDLYNDILILMNDNRFNHFQDVTPTIESIQDLLKAYPEEFFSQEETLALLEGFFERNGFAPRTAQQAADVTEEELQLNFSITHWLQNDSHFQYSLRMVYDKFAKN